MSTRTLVVGGWRLVGRRGGGDGEGRRGPVEARGRRLLRIATAPRDEEVDSREGDVRYVEWHERYE